MFQEYLASITASAFIFQVIILITPMLGSYFAYRQLRAPKKFETTIKALRELGYEWDTDGNVNRHQQGFTARDYMAPLFYATALTAIAYSVTHPYTVHTLGIWKGLLEQFITIFGTSEMVEVTGDLFVGRFLLYGFIGAYIYTVNMIFQRYLQYDLSPSVYIFVSTRFLVAIFISAIVGLALGVINNATEMSFDMNLMTVSVVAFFIGFFPERGLDWIMAMSKRVLNQTTNVANETRLSELEGLSIWHQGRFLQESIENVQNLATADIPSLIINTPFSMPQVIDWIDQSILIVYANEMYKKIENVGVRCASDFLVAGESEAMMQKLAAASEVDIDKLWLLYMSVQNAANIRVTTYYRWRHSINPQRVAIAMNMPRINISSTQTTKIVAAENVEPIEDLLPSPD